MWIRNFINEQKLTEEIRKLMREIGAKGTRVPKKLKDQVIADMQLMGSVAVRRHYREKSAAKLTDDLLKSKQSRKRAIKLRMSSDSHPTDF